jgi:GNAT superfamily N-acetyltransferase
MTPFAVRSVGEDERAALVVHFLALPMRDRCLRFGMSLAPTVIAAYVDRIDFTRDAVFGVCDDRYALVGAAHLALENGVAELALSVLPEYRARGMGSALFEHSVAQAGERGTQEIVMRCLTGDTPVVRMARRFGMSIVTVDGLSDARLALMPTRRVGPLSVEPLAAVACAAMERACGMART